MGTLTTFLNCRMHGVILWTAVGCAFVLNTVRAQTQAPYVLEWQSRQAPATKPIGNDYVWNTDPTSPVYAGSARTTPLNQTIDESGADWWHSVIPIKQGGNHVGYVAVGYSSFNNWGISDGCYSYAIPFGGTFPTTVFNQTFTRRRSQVRNTVARFDLAGNLVWYKYYFMESLFDVIQDANEDIVVTGDAGNSVPLADMNTALPLYHNPSAANPNQSLQTTGCTSPARHCLVMKLDLNGNALWHSVYTPMDVPGNATMADVMQRRSSGQSIVATTFSGTPGYRIVGFGSMPGVAENPFMLDVDQNGQVLGKQLLTTFPGASDVNNPTGFSRALHISHTTVAGVEHYAMTGLRIRSLSPGNFDAFLWVFNDAGSLFFKDTRQNASEVGCSTSLHHVSSSSTFTSNSPPNVIWAVLSDHTTDGTNTNANLIFAGQNHQARSKVLGYDLSGAATWSTPADVGISRGLELQLDLKTLSTGEIAVSTTKWPADLNASAPFDFTKITSASRNCLQSTMVFDSNGANADVPANNGLNGVMDWANPLQAAYPRTISALDYFYGYRGTDSHVRVIDAATGALKWEYQWDEGTGASSTNCYTENYRQRQCNFKIVESPSDNGLVVCGNAGFNQDDAYLAKLRPCDQFATYTNLPLDANGEHHITANTTWNTNRTIKGKVVIDPGKTLTINSGAVIRFADTRQVGITTNITVMPGGKLTVTGSSILTSLQNCPYSMWDGIVVLGNPALSQSPPSNQGTVDMSNSSIRNAMAAILAGNVADPMAPYTGTVTQQGGRVLLNNITFRNNLHDVVLHAYASQIAPDYTPTSFTNCTFETTQALNYYWLTPDVHVWASGYPRLKVYGSTFRNTSGLNTADPVKWGVGLQVSQGSVQVLANTSSVGCSFQNLARGVYHSNTLPSKLIDMRSASFSGCGAGAYIAGSAVPTVVSNTFAVPDLDVSGMGLSAAYGCYIDQCTGFGYENNDFDGPGSAAVNPSVGAVFNITGPASNVYYNNRFDGLYAGTIIMGSNDGPAINDGLHIKCNDYSQVVDNQFDVAFTDVGVTIGDQQGAAINQASPAGNTFSPNFSCVTPGPNTEEHFAVDIGGINTFNYVHHVPLSTVQLVPECAASPIVPSGLGTWYSNSGQPYVKPQACPGTLLVDGGDGEMMMAAGAAEQEQVLKAVYDDWKDGGDTEGLQAYVSDPSHDSYSVRNQLMLVAPKVSDEVWKAVFERMADLSPWHVAQALIANSPINAETYQLMVASGLSPYYRQLVEDAQNGGANMQSIMESELAHFHQQKASAIHALTNRALLDSLPGGLDSALLALELYPLHAYDHDALALAVRSGDLGTAENLVDQGLSDGLLPEFYEVQQLLLGTLQNVQDMAALDASQVQQLEAIAEMDVYGSAHASAWLRSLGLPTQVERIVLPLSTRSVTAGQGVNGYVAEVFLQVQPNPSDGHVVVIVKVPEGVEYASIRVLDLLGRLVAEKPIAGGRPLVELPTLEVSGLYMAVLYLDGVRAGVAKFQVAR